MKYSDAGQGYGHAYLHDFACAIQGLLCKSVRMHQHALPAKRSISRVPVAIVFLPCTMLEIAASLFCHYAGCSRTNEKVSMRKHWQIRQSKNHVRLA